MAASAVATESPLRAAAPSASYFEYTSSAGTAMLSADLEALQA